MYYIIYDAGVSSEHPNRTEDFKRKWFEFFCAENNIDRSMMKYTQYRTENIIQDFLSWIPDNCNQPVFVFGPDWRGHHRDTVEWANFIADMRQSLSSIPVTSFMMERGLANNIYDFSFDTSSTEIPKVADQKDHFQAIGPQSWLIDELERI